MRVCIFGSGLSALTLAKALVNQNIFVDIIDTNSKHKINKSRTIGISKSNLDYFNKEIINIEKIVWKINKIEIYSENLKSEKILNFKNDKDSLFSILMNYNLFEILKKSLSKNKFFKKIKSKKKLFKLENYNLIINTDFSSFLTKKYFSKKISKTYNSLAYTTIINHEEISNKDAVQIFTKLGPIAFLPISKYKSSVVYSIVNSKKISEEKVIKLIKRYNFKYKIKKIDKVECFYLKSFALRSYHYKNVLAFGDLLHRIHPLAGQGFNMTIRDINILNKIIKEKTELGLSLDVSVNSEFEKISKHKNYLFSNGIDLIYEFFNFERKLDNNILGKSVKLLGKKPYLNKLFTRIADEGIRF